MNRNYLVDYGFVLDAIQDDLEILYPRVAHANALQLPLVLECLKYLPEGFQFPGGIVGRVVDQKKVGDKAELFDGRFDGLANLIEGHFTSHCFFREQFVSETNDVRLLVTYISSLGRGAPDTICPVASSVL